MRILLASSEVHPYSKTGGLADMVGALAKSLARAGHQAGVVTPLYAGIRDQFPQIQKMDWWMDLPLGNRRVSAEVWSLALNGRLTIYFVHQPEFFQRNGLYQEGGWDYPDNAARFTFFSKAVVHLARYLPWQPQVVHIHDWQTGLAPLFIRHQQDAEGWGTAPRTCLTIHNLAYQGHFAASQYALGNLPWDYFHPDGAEFYGGLNFLKVGIIYANAIVAVSPRYAREITTPEFGFGLDAVLRRRQGVLTGILNGVDYEEWNTTQNPHLPAPFSAARLAGKAAAKQALQQELGLPERPAVPLFGNITRLVEQKGVRILLGALEEMLAADLQCVVLGAGVPEFESAVRGLARRFPAKLAARFGYDNALSHRIEAGCDFYLMPSQFEPCGLNQMYSLRYGAIPIVRQTGGLDDSVVDLTDDQKGANGIKFNEYSARALVKAMRKALVLYQERTLLAHYRHNAMRADFSWDKSAAEYLKVYDRILTMV
jgi:starch synthase